MTEQPSAFERVVDKILLHAHLSPTAQEALLTLPHRRRTLEPLSYCLREGDRPERCIFLLSGYAVRHKLTGNGARQILSVYLPGDPLDLQNIFLEESDHNVQVLTRSEIAEVPRPVLQELVLGNPEVGRAILMATLVEASMFREWMLNIGRRDARSRIAHLLCEMALRLSLSDEAALQGIELPMTQEQLADATALTPVHVNRVLKELERQGVITRDRKHVHFPDWRQLEAVADFSPRYLHINLHQEVRA